jgi:hypothetical protein
MRIRQDPDANSRRYSFHPNHTRGPRSPKPSPPHGLFAKALKDREDRSSEAGRYAPARSPRQPLRCFGASGETGSRRRSASNDDTGTTTARTLAPCPAHVAAPPRPPHRRPPGTDPVELRPAPRSLPASAGRPRPPRAGSRRIARPIPGSDCLRYVLTTAALSHCRSSSERLAGRGGVRAPGLIDKTDQTAATDRMDFYSSESSKLPRLRRGIGAPSAPHPCRVSPRSSIATNPAIRFARVSGRLASSTR